MNTNGKVKKWKEYYRKLHAYVLIMQAYEKAVQEYANSFENGESEIDPPPPPPENPPPPPNP
jgi:hypothetical protein